MAAQPVALAVSRELDESPDPEPEPRTTAIAGGCLYTALLIASVVWLLLRGRISALQAASIGDHGVAAALGSGLGVGLAGFAIFALLLSRLPSIAPLHAQARKIFAPMGDTPILTLVVLGAVAEEMFFRLAVQDQFGLVGSVAAYSLLSTCAMGLRWLPMAVLHATALGLLVWLGFGLLASTIANAVMNYLCLRRMLTT